MEYYFIGSSDGKKHLIDSKEILKQLKKKAGFIKDEIFAVHDGNAAIALKVVGIETGKITFKVTLKGVQNNA